MTMNHLQSCRAAYFWSKLVSGERSAAVPLGDTSCGFPTRYGWRGSGRTFTGLLILVGSLVMPSMGRAQEPDVVASDTAPKKEPLPIELGSNWMRATKDYEVWVDFKQKQVLVGGSVCLREGLLEMFACPQGTKEHESVVAANTPARFVHGALVAIGAKPGPPVQFEPQYKPAEGTPIEVTVVWKDKEDKEHRVRAQEWVKCNSTGKSLEYPWVFAGSGFWIDEAAGERFYYADGGEFICVSNFSTAMLDLPVESSGANDALMFSAFTERIPPRGTRVCLVLTPQLKAKEAQQPAPPKETPSKDTEKVQSESVSESADSVEQDEKPAPKKR